MIKAIFKGSRNIKSYQTKEFDASHGNTVFMSEEIWMEIKNRGDAKLFKKVVSDAKKFPPYRNVSPGVPFDRAKIKQSN